MWQKAKFIGREDHPPFWVFCERPITLDLLPFDEQNLCWTGEKETKAYYRTNVINPVTRDPLVFLYVGQDDVELLSEFQDEVTPDTRFVEKGE